ncbi:GNAT family N-acetyltransferase [Actinoplanes sp. NBC_00393]|uniref:GNAT family N-acetyltransferase n=1 Tax=Actinoplanes sp. NBC_00393 TaxID=2975953 RepID=UPI002E1E4E90
MVIVRPATLADSQALAVVQTRTSQQVYRGVMPAAYLDRLDTSRRRQVWQQLLESERHPAGTLVLDDAADGVVGFVNVAPSSDADTDPGVVGEVRAVYVLPQHWGRGAGRLLMDAGLRRLADAGYRQVILWVLEANHRARRFYEAAGWRTDGASKTDDARGVPLTAIRYRRSLDGGSGLPAAGEAR